MTLNECETKQENIEQHIIMTRTSAFYSRVVFCLFLFVSSSFAHFYLCKVHVCAVFYLLV